MKFVRVPKGTFWMGGGSVEGPPTNQVTIDADFELAAYAVTQGQWETVMGLGSNPSWFSRQGQGSATVADISDADLQRFPVESVAWKDDAKGNDVQEFLRKLNEREQGKGWQYRLPKEAEWEYASRGAATTKEECSFDFYFAAGTNDLSWDEANFDGGFPAGGGKKGKALNRPTKVGQYPPNKLGLYDMHGNVWVWCAELYDNPDSPRMMRGGSWFNPAAHLRSAVLNRYGPGGRGDDLGVRLARTRSGG